MARKRYSKGKRVDMRKGGRIGFAEGEPIDEIVVKGKSPNKRRFKQRGRSSMTPPKVKKYPAMGDPNRAKWWKDRAKQAAKEQGEYPEDAVGAVVPEPPVPEPDPSPASVGRPMQRIVRKKQPRMSPVDDEPFPTPKTKRRPRDRKSVV